MINKIIVITVTYIDSTTVSILPTNGIGLLSPKARIIAFAFSRNSYLSFFEPKMFRCSVIYHHLHRWLESLNMDAFADALHQLWTHVLNESLSVLLGELLDEGNAYLTLDNTLWRLARLRFACLANPNKIVLFVELITFLRHSRPFQSIHAWQVNTTTCYVSSCYILWVLAYLSWL